MAAYLERVSQAPAWMIERVAMIAESRQGSRSLRESIEQAEFEASSVLRGEVEAFPRLAELVPQEFIIALKAGNGSTMAPRERGAIVILESDAGMSTSRDFADCLEVFLQLKWATLAWLLEGAADD